MEKKSNKGLKKLILLLLLFVGLGASVTAGAYWASGFTVADSNVANGDLSVTIGSGKVVTLNTTLTFDTENDGDVLVPTPYIEPDVTTDTRVITITGNWAFSSGQLTAHTAEKTGATGTLNAVITYSLGTLTKTQIDAMFDISVTTGVAITIGTGEDIVVTVKFAREPETKALYDLVKGQTLTINITLSVVVE